MIEITDKEYQYFMKLKARADRLKLKNKASHKKYRQTEKFKIANRRAQAKFQLKSIDSLGLDGDSDTT
tara:strand:+ start:78 stop:281 length:204 start_codon:yes stop_codon:yes gene_type:complete